MIKLAKDLVEENSLSLDNIRSIGIGIPGTINNSTGIVEYANNLKFKDFP